MDGSAHPAAALSPSVYCRLYFRRVRSHGRRKRASLPEDLSHELQRFQGIFLFQLVDSETGVDENRKRALGAAHAHDGALAELALDLL